MGLDLGGAVNSAADWLCGAPLIGRVVGNPLFAALLVTALAAIVVLALFRRACPPAAGSWRRTARALLYVYLLTSAVLFVQHYAAARCARASAMTEGGRAVVNAVEESRAFGGGTPVWPAGEAPFAGGEDAELAAAMAPPAAAPRAVGGAPAPASQRAVGGAPAPASQRQRPDNVAPSGLNIEDVVLPSLSGPPLRTKSG